MRIENVPCTIYPTYGMGCPTTTNDRSKNGTDKEASGTTQDQRVQRYTQELRMQEQKVIAHEMAHKTAGGQYAGAIRYQYTTGPDGRAYISGGEVSIDTSEANTSEETVRKMEQVKRAALAPQQPSPEDYSVASAATRAEQQARYQLMKEKDGKDHSKTATRVDKYA